MARKGGRGSVWENLPKVEDKQEYKTIDNLIDNSIDIEEIHGWWKRNRWVDHNNRKERRAYIRANKNSKVIISHLPDGPSGPGISREYWDNIPF